MLQFHGAAIRADEGEVGSQSRALVIYSMAGQASAFVIEQFLTASGIAHQARSMGRVVSERVQIGDDGGCLEIVERFVGRHSRARDAFLHNRDQFAFGAVGCVTELALAEIGVGERVAIGAMTVNAMDAVKSPAVFDVGGGIAVLRQERAGCQKK